MYVQNTDVGLPNLSFVRHLARNIVVMFQGAIPNAWKVVWFCFHQWTSKLPAFTDSTHGAKYRIVISYHSFDYLSFTVLSSRLCLQVNRLSSRRHRCSLLTRAIQLIHSLSISSSSRWVAHSRGHNSHHISSSQAVSSQHRGAVSAVLGEEGVLQGITTSQHSITPPLIDNLIKPGQWVELGHVS